MPFYPCVDVETGREHEVFRAMCAAPPIGTEFTHAGRTYRRTPSPSQVSADVEARVHGYPYCSRSLPRNLAGCDKDRAGRPIIRSRNHEREVMARHGLERD